MLEKIIQIARSQADGASRPIMLAIAGDSASGKTTLARGLTQAIGEDRCLSISVDDYHKFDRAERKELPFTPLHPDCNYLDIVEQHLQLLALGRPILKPVYDHSTGTFTRPEYVEPTEFVIVEGLHPLATKLMRACFDVMVFLDPPEKIRHQWKIDRDCSERGYTPAQVAADLERREPESALFIRPQRRFADIVVRFAPISMGDDSPETPLSAELMLRPTIQHPALNSVLSDDHESGMQLKIIRDRDGTPTDCLHIHGHASAEDAQHLQKAIWDELDAAAPATPEHIGEIGSGARSEPLALTQLILLYHLLQGSANQADRQPGKRSAVDSDRNA